MTESEYKEAVNKFSNMIFRLAFVYLKNKYDAEDCCQNVFIKLYLYDKKFKDDEHIKAWLIKVTKNQCTDLWRSIWRRKVDLTSEEIVKNLPLEKREIIETVLTLPSKYRDIIYLHYYEGYKISEISSMLDIKESTAKVRLMRGREALKKLLTKEANL